MALPAINVILDALTLPEFFVMDVSEADNSIFSTGIANALDAIWINAV
jgi:hypothetical protein